MTNDTTREIIIQLIKLKNVHRDDVVEILLNRVDADYLEYIIQDLLNSDDSTTIRGL